MISASNVAFFHDHTRPENVTTRIIFQLLDNIVQRLSAKVEVHLVHLPHEIIKASKPLQKLPELFLC